jgi:hypothetical protein
VLTFSASGMVVEAFKLCKHISLKFGYRSTEIVQINCFLSSLVTKAFRVSDFFSHVRFLKGSRTGNCLLNVGCRST